MREENEALEFKTKITDKILKEIIAFANTKGGTIIIGYNDDSSVCGITNAKKECEKLSNMIHNNIEPNIDFLISQEIKKEDNKDIIVLQVLKGINKPYYLKSKGMTPSGVFIRLGSTSLPAPSNLIREMIIDSAGISFEKNISTNQDLTFNYLEKKFKEKNIRFEKRDKKTLGLLNEQNKYTNLGLLFSDQCPYTFKIGVYPENTKTEFIDRKETKGSLLEQLDEANNYLKLNNKVASKIIGLERKENPDYENEALRECLLNAIAHRDYEINGSNLIHVYKNEIEFLSLGGLVNGLTIEDIKLGISSSRNPKLVNILHRLGLVEAYGSGIPRILKIYDNKVRKPNIKIAPNTFLIKLPKMIVKKEYDLIKTYLLKNKICNRSDIEKLLNLKKTRTGEILKEMSDKGLILKEGGSKKIIYRLK